MSPPLDLLEVAGLLADICERLRVSYALGGAIAQNIWGVVRATQDVDILVSVPRIRFEDLRGELSSAGFSLLDADGHPIPITVEGMVAQERDRHLIAVVLGSVKAEIFFPFLPLQHSILRRAVKLKLGRRDAPITTAEDLVLLKMAFHREKDLRDVRGILWVQKGRLDLAYIRQWAGRMLLEQHCEQLESWIRRYGG